MNVVRVLVIKINMYKNYYRNNAHVKINVPRICIAPVSSGNHRILSARRAQVITRETLYRQTELNIHANITVAGGNCVTIWHTEILCDVVLFVKAIIKPLIHHHVLR